MGRIWHPGSAPQHHRALGRQRNHDDLSSAAIPIGCATLRLQLRPVLCESVPAGQRMHTLSRWFAALQLFLHQHPPVVSVIAPHPIASRSSVFVLRWIVFGTYAAVSRCESASECCLCDPWPDMPRRASVAFLCRCANSSGCSSPGVCLYPGALLVVSDPHVVPTHEASPGLSFLHCVLVVPCTRMLHVALRICVRSSS